MRPESRHHAIIELLTRWQQSRQPLDILLAQWGKANRYAGGGDRQAIAEILYGIIRHLGQLDWWLIRANLHFSDDEAGEYKRARARLIAYFNFFDSSISQQLEELWDGQDYAPFALGPSERRLAIELAAQPNISISCQPGHITANVPELIYDQFVADYELPRAVDILEKLKQPASVDLRVNRLKANRNGVKLLLKKQGLMVEETPHSPDGIRLTKRAAITQLDLFKQGWIEPQDESAQIAALLVDAKPSMKIIDYCAGAGGKSLALAAIMENKGRIVAMDDSAPRLARATTRFRRADIHLVECKALDEAGRKWVKRQIKQIKAQPDKAGYDRVLVDVPCSGSGTWRRNPDQKWRMDQDSLNELAALQFKIILEAAPLVKKGGRLIYATCSMFSVENQGIINRFLHDHSQFKIVPIADIWQQLFSAPYPADNPDMLQLSPDRVPSDGFFIAVLERIA